MGGRGAAVGAGRLPLVAPLERGVLAGGVVVGRRVATGRGDGIAAGDGSLLAGPAIDDGAKLRDARSLAVRRAGNVAEKVLRARGGRGCARAGRGFASGSSRHVASGASRARTRALFSASSSSSSASRVSRAIGRARVRLVIAERPKHAYRMATHALRPFPARSNARARDGRDASARGVTPSAGTNAIVIRSALGSSKRSMFSCGYVLLMLQTICGGLAIHRRRRSPSLRTRIRCTCVGKGASGER